MEKFVRIIYIYMVSAAIPPKKEVPGDTSHVFDASVDISLNELVAGRSTPEIE